MLLRSVPFWLGLLEDWDSFIDILLLTSTYLFKHRSFIVDFWAKSSGPVFLRVFLVPNAIHLISDVFLVLKFSHENVLVPLMNRPLVINHNFIFKFRSL